MAKGRAAGAQADETRGTDGPAMFVGSLLRDIPSGEAAPVGERKAAGAERKAAERAERKGRKAAERRAAEAAARAQIPVAEPVGLTRPKARHALMVMTFVATFLLPTALSAWYLWNRAEDQFASYVGFSIRAEDVSAAVEGLFGGFGLGAQTGAETDADIVYDYIRSQQLVERIDARLDLRSVWSGPHEDDPIYALAPDASLEELVDYWNRQVSVSLDSASNLLELRVLAFDPESARTIAGAVFEESSATINRLTAIAREDATRYAREELERSLERLKDARAALLRFRNDNRIVDPVQDLTLLMGVLNSLQGQLAEAFIELDLLRDTTRTGDPRLVQAEQRIGAIEARIEQERAKFGGGEESGAYSQLVGEYERLSVDLEFAEAAHNAALTSYDAALSEAQRQSRYLAAYIGPTTAQTAEYPRRALILLLISTFLFMAWAIAMLAWYSVRDRR